jgi:integration host factor subunit alpha
MINLWTGISNHYQIKYTGCLGLLASSLESQFYLGFCKYRGDPTMTLTKAQIIESIQNQTGFPKSKSSDIVESLLEIIKSTLASGEDVLVSGFGKFSVRKKNERKGRNPATGEAMMLDARKVVTFKSSGKLRDRVNG